MREESTALARPTTRHLCGSATALLALVVVWVGVGCGKEKGDDEPQGTCRAEENSEPLTACDIRDPACQRHCFCAVARIRRTPTSGIPMVRVIDIPTYEEMFNSDPSEPTEITPYERALIVLGLLAPRSTADDELDEMQKQYVAAFYSTGGGGITIIDRAEPMDSAWIVSVLAHEFVHALQDDEIGLIDFYNAFYDGNDTLLALDSVIEGDAVLFQDLAYLEMQELQPDEVDFIDYFVRLRQSLFDRMDEEKSPIVYGSFMFPYIFGEPYTYGAWLHGDSKAVRKLFEDPPLTTAEIFRGYGDAWYQPTELAWRLSNPDYKTLGGTTLGAWPLLAFLHQHIDPDLAWQAASRWRSDELWLYETRPSPGSLCLAWAQGPYEEEHGEPWLALAAASESSALTTLDVDGHSVVVGCEDEAELTAWIDVVLAGASLTSSPRGTRSGPEPRLPEPPLWIAPGRDFR